MSSEVVTVAQIISLVAWVLTGWLVLACVGDGVLRMAYKSQWSALFGELSDE